MFESLLSPIRVGRLDLPNRVLITAHATNYVDADNLPDARAVHYYAERARGGAGLMITGASSVHPTSPTVRGVVDATHPRAVAAWRAIADAVHAAGGRILVMLTHMGRVGRMPDTRPLVAPSPLIDGNFHQFVPHELTAREIDALVVAFARAAARVRESGMDGVELQGAHGYLIAQFLSPLSNRRTDGYGGDLAGRLRFALEVVDATRRAVGADYTLGIRLSADELVPGGLALDETRKTLYPLQRRLREQGVEMLPSTRFAGWDGARPLLADVFTGARRTLADVETVVWAAPGQAAAELVAPLRAAGLEVHAVGDCVAPRRVEHAVHEAHAIARGL